MRCVPALAECPPALSEYLKEHPQDAYVSGADAKGAWDRFRDKGYQPLLASLVMVQQGLCAYCEQRLVDEAGRLIHQDYQVEHLLPKSGGEGRALNWTNLLLCCTGGSYKYHKDSSRFQPGRRNRSCGEKKGADPVPNGFDPRQLSPGRSVFRVGIDGRLAADRTSCNAVGLEPESLDEIVDFFGLNCERLRLARKRLRGQAVEAWLARHRTLSELGLPASTKQSHLARWAQARLGVDKAGFLKQFWTVELGVLGPVGVDWLVKASSQPS